MGYVKWSYDTLNTFCHDVFRKFGFNEEETNIIKDVLLTADLYGIESHGMQRMVRYDKGIEKGTIHPDAKPEVVFETPVSAVIDGHDGMGQLISHFAMEKAIEKAKKTGVGFVSVRNSNHFERPVLLQEYIVYFLDRFLLYSTSELLLSDHSEILSGMFDDLTAGIRFPRRSASHSHAPKLYFRTWQDIFLQSAQQNAYKDVHLFRLDSYSHYGKDIQKSKRSDV